ncbi:MAG: hypothetical protein H6824_08770 [Planctomycetaceae bacterium]|nr:hypothetical protein [Planctomycetaceae bacterium]
MFRWLRNLFDETPDPVPPKYRPASHAGAANNGGALGSESDSIALGRRSWHYAFAHVALRQHAEAEPAATIAILGNEKASQFLDDLAKQVNAWCEQNGEPIGEFGDWTVHRKRIDGMPVAVVEMPAPVAPPEAYFVAIILQTTDLTPEAMKAASARYFTLERSINLEGNTTTMMCEWTQDGTHCNLGAGPEPQVDAFLSKLKTMFS